MHSINGRTWVVRWMYAVAIVHLLVGFALPWIGNLPVFDSYHRTVENVFWTNGAPESARAQQIWWISLFGPTIQGLSLWMWALIYIGDRHCSRFAWGSLFIGIAVWAPQDMLISLRADAWIHVWIDCFASMTMLPPLLWLWWHDRTE
ncbi:MAG TPA: cell division protein [Oxalicibacterium sp.]|uniref:cell division protein n=1 Tax=Oxalicibacterium sp. TaxID=2766525 RepID=UPI002BB583C0|nr:cell division protein [Oxalicibacterium sp.]HWU96910.1 cell division protein [Oxalicibacterium sp.]